MNRFTAILVLGAAMALPTFANAQCGCGCDAPVVAACDSVCGSACDSVCGCESACDSVCGCESAGTCDPCNACTDCCKPTRKRLRLVRVNKEVCRTQRVCTTDCCGCPKSTRVRVRKCVSRLRLVRVEVPKRTRCCKKTKCCDTCNSGCNTCDTGCGCGCG